MTVYVRMHIRVCSHTRNSIKTADGMFYTSAIYAYMLAHTNTYTHIDECIIDDAGGCVYCRQSEYC